MVDHDRMEESVAAYVLDACDTDERESVRAHMEGCLACRALATRLTQAAHALPLASEVVRPPDRLRARILAAAAASPPAEGREPAGRRPAPAPPPVAAERRRAAARLPGLQRLRFPVLVGAVAALAVALLGLAAWNVTLNQQLRQPPARYSMSGTGTLSGVSATVTAYRASDVTLVSFTGLPQPAPGRVYEMWLIDAGGRPKPAGVFTPDAGGGATVQVDGSLRDARVMAVTEEVGPRGVEAPTQKPQLAGQVG